MITEARPRSSRSAAVTAWRADALVALGLGLAAAALFALTLHPDWIFDPLKYADLIQRGQVRDLLGPQHAMANLVPLLAYRLAHLVGYGGRAAPVLGGFSVFGGAAAVALTYLGAVGFGATRGAAATAAALLAVTPVLLRAGGSEGVYGPALAMLALAWVAAARYARRPSERGAALTGVAAGGTAAFHLATLTFAPAALVLVLALPGTARRRDHAMAFGAAALATVCGLFLLTALVAGSWSASGVARWFQHPGIAGPGDASRAVGWGLSGLFGMVGGRSRPGGGIPLGLDPQIERLAVALTLVALGVVAVRAWRMLRRPGRSPIVAASLMTNAGLALLAASWYQALRTDYFGLALIPLAIVGAAGGRPPDTPATASLPPRRGWRPRPAMVVLTALVVGGLLWWNLQTEVIPSLQRSRARTEAARAIAAAVPGGSSLVLSPYLAGRLAAQGFHANGGWAALSEAVADGEDRPGLDAILPSLEGPPVFVSSRAFDLSPDQIVFLGSTPDGIWASMQDCCRPQPVLEFVTGLGPETLYRLTPPAT